MIAGGMGQFAGQGNGFFRPGQRSVRKAEHPQADALLGSRTHRRVVTAVYEGVREMLGPIEGETLCRVLTYRPPLAKAVLRCPLGVMGLQQQGLVPRAPGDREEPVGEVTRRAHLSPGAIAGPQATQRGEQLGRLAAQSVTQLVGARV